MNMMDLSSIKNIAEVTAWFLTLGRAELRQVRTEAEELLGDLRKSLVNLWDITVEVTKLTPEQLSLESFQPVHDYFIRFYLDPQNISAARTHCGYVERDVERITFKLSTLLHSDLGKWAEAREKLKNIIDYDGSLLRSYDECIQILKQKLSLIRDKLQSGDISGARYDYRVLRQDLEKDVFELDKYMKQMREASDHLWKVTG